VEAGATFESRGFPMGRLIVRVLGAIGAGMLSVATFGSGVAYADALTGQTYNDAVAKISEWNGEAVIATVNGGQLEMDDCIVAGWQRSIFLDSSGDNTRTREYLLHLNCNNSVATPGHPGNSAASPQGVKAKKDQEAAANINKNPDFCEQSDEIAQWCKGVCNRTGLCEV
jgi:hypothetical protein